MNPYWTKAPLLLLLRYRKIFVAVLGSAALLGLSSIAGPMFLSASGSAALEEQLRGQPPLVIGFRIGAFGDLGGADTRAGRDENDALLRDTIGAQPHIGEPVVTILGPDRPVTVTGDDNGPLLSPAPAVVRLIARSGSTEHVRIVDGNAQGALISTTTARELDVSPGDQLSVGRGTDVTVTGIYRSLVTSRADPYWFTLGGLIFPTPNGATPAPFMLLSEDQLFAVAEDLDLQGNIGWEFPVRAADLTLQKAGSIASYMQTIERAVNDNEDIGDEDIQLLRDRFTAAGGVVAQFPRLVSDARATVTALEGPVLVLSLAGRLVALAVMAAAGAYLVVSRRTEVQLLVARGMSYTQQGTRSLIEALLPGIIGAFGGAIVGVALVRAVGPSQLIAPEDTYGAIVQTVITFAVGLVTLGGAAAFTVRSQTGPQREQKKNPFTQLPWEIPVFILAGAAFYEISTRGTVVIKGDEGDRIDIFVLLFPILFLAGIAGIVARFMRAGFDRLRSITGDRPATYLATRRLAAAPGSIVGLLIASVLSVGILVYAQSLAETIQTSTEAKAGVFVGSDVSLLVYATTELPDDFPLPATKVRKIPHLTMTNGTGFTMMGIDRDSFERAAFWDTSFAGGSLSQLLDELDPVEGEPLPVLVAAGEDTIESQPSVDLSTDVEVEPVEFIRAFPGLPAGEPLVIADFQGMGDLFAGVNSAATANAQDQIWARGTLNQVTQAAAEADIPFGTVTSTAQVLARPTLASVTWAFDLLKALGMAAGSIALLAVLLYMQARQRSTVVAYAMSRRMGLTSKQHAASLVIELSAVLLLAIVAGTLAAVGVARLIYSHLDLLPQIPPSPLLRVPGMAVLALAAVGLVAAAVGAALVQRGADRARVAEVLRLAE